MVEIKGKNVRDDPIKTNKAFNPSGQLSGDLIKVFYRPNDLGQ